MIKAVIKYTSFKKISKKVKINIKCRSVWKLKNKPYNDIWIKKTRIEITELSDYFYSLLTVKACE